MTLICGALVLAWISFRIRYSPEQRQQVIADLEAKREVAGRPLDRTRLAHRATKHKKAVQLTTPAGAECMARARGWRNHE